MEHGPLTIQTMDAVYMTSVTGFQICDPPLLPSADLKIGKDVDQQKLRFLRHIPTI